MNRTQERCSQEKKIDFTWHFNYSLTHTNRKINKTMHNLSDEVWGSEKYSHLNDIAETKLFWSFGVLYARGLLN